MKTNENIRINCVNSNAKRTILMGQNEFRRIETKRRSVQFFFNMKKNLFVFVGGFSSFQISSVRLAEARRKAKAVTTNKIAVAMISKPVPHPIFV